MSRATRDDAIDIPYLSRIGIGNFGCMKDVRIGTFKPGLNVAYGQNEAGKSTASRLITDVLFGWLPTRSDTIVTKGPKAGSLLFNGDEGEWELVRDKNDTEVRTLRGALWSSAFEDICSSVTRETYASVFAFDADKLNGLKGDNQQITAQLITASSGAHVAPIALANELNDRCIELRSKSTTSPDGLGSIRAAIGECDQRVKELGETSEELKQEEFELLDLRARLGSLQDERATVEAEHARTTDDLRLLGELIERRPALEARVTELEGIVSSEDRALENGELTDTEAVCLRNSRGIRTAKASTDTLRRALSDVETQRALVRKAEDDLHACVDRGCLCTASAGSNLERYRREILEATVAFENARRKHDDQDSNVAAQRLRARQAEVPARRRDGSKVTAAISTAVLLIVAFAQGYMAVSSSSPLLFATAALTVAAGGAGVAVWFKSRDAARSSVTSYDRQSLDIALADCEAARVEEENARHRLDEVNHDVTAYLHEGRFATESVDEALGFLNDQIHFEEQRGKLDVEQRHLDDSQANLDDVRGKTAQYLDFHELGAMDIPQLLILVEDLGSTLNSAVEKTQTRGMVQAERAQRASELLRAREDLLAHRAAIARLGTRYSAEREESLQGLIARRREEQAARRLEIDGRINESNVRIGKIATRLSDGDSSLDLERAELERAGLATKRLEVAQEYLANALALELVDQSIRIWERERQPTVYLLASQALEEMTKGEWVKVDYDGQHVYVINQDSRRKDPEMLSNGARQQLYLALRIALLISSDDIAPSLPVIADDILVNFDEYRREGAVRAIARLARTRQVILFTCHKETQELFKRMVPDANVLEISAR